MRRLRNVTTRADDNGHRILAGSGRCWPPAGRNEPAEIVRTARHDVVSCLVDCSATCDG